LARLALDERYGRLNGIRPSLRHDPELHVDVDCLILGSLQTFDRAAAYLSRSALIIHPSASDETSGHWKQASLVRTKPSGIVVPENRVEFGHRERGGQCKPARRVALPQPVFQMAANFPHMGGQMMPNQQQRPPQNGAPTQINQLIFQTLSAQTGPLTGWQAGVLIQERISLISNIIGNLRLASQHQVNPPPMSKMMEIGLKFEKDIFEKSVDKVRLFFDWQNANTVPADIE
ncbi:hypothetical protein DH86_00000897, partial [Scytalidium sp. 3C]